MKTKTAERAQFEKDYTALKHYLIGRDYVLALRALGAAELYHTGMRKDNKTPELHHQVRICFNIINLRGVSNEELCLAGALLHDVIEDYDVPQNVLAKLCGDEMAECAWRLDKRNGFDLSTCPICSIIKGADNADNVLSMTGVFNVEKMRSYIKRTQTEILPMLKRASKLFPEQQLAYSSLSSLLKKQIQLNNAYIAVAQSGEFWAESQQTVRDRNAELIRVKADAERYRLELERVKTELEDFKQTKIGAKARHVIALSELYKEVALLPKDPTLKTVFERLINKWNLHPSFLLLLDDEKLDVTEALKRL